MTRALPTISIVTPSFNQGAYIERTIVSILEQEYPSLEHIVMDGGSTDGTLEVLKRYEGTVRWFSGRDNGQSDAINKGLRMATGDVLAFLNSDDVYEPGALFRVGEYFARRPDAGWVTGKCRNIGPDGREIRKGITLYKNAWLRLHSRKVLLVLNYISQPATFWRKEVFDQVGVFDENLQYVMDYDYWLRIAQRYPLHVIDAYLARFRIHGTSKGRTSAKAQFEEGLTTASRYTRSPGAKLLHRLHAVATVGTYRVLVQRDRRMDPGA